VVRDLGNRPVRLELLEALLARERHGRRSVVDQPVLREALERRGLHVLEEERSRPAEPRRALERSLRRRGGGALHRVDVVRRAGERCPLRGSGRALDEGGVVRIRIRPSGPGRRSLLRSPAAAGGDREQNGQDERARHPRAE
jgi:hypothetical protein